MVSRFEILFFERSVEQALMIKQINGWVCSLATSSINGLFKQGIKIKSNS